MSFPFDPFAETAQLQRTECRNGISYRDLSLTAANVFFASLREEYRPTQDADLAPWEAVAGKAASIIDLPESEQGTLEVSAKSLAKALYSQFIIEQDKIPDWDLECSQGRGLAWEAVGRHLANLIDSDGTTPNFPELEERIVTWARERSQPTQLVLS